METMRRFPFRIEIVSMHRPDRPGAFSTVFTAWDSESLTGYTSYGSVFFHHIDERFSVCLRYIEVDELNTWLNLEMNCSGQRIA